jgi:hypothetical protein
MLCATAGDIYLYPNAVPKFFKHKSAETLADWGMISTNCGTQIEQAGTKV